MQRNLVVEICGYLVAVTLRFFTGAEVLLANPADTEGTDTALRLVMTVSSPKALFLSRVPLVIDAKIALYFLHY